MMTHYTTEEQIHDIPLSWAEEVQLEHQQQHQAFYAFFADHSFDSHWQWLHRIPDDLRSELLICDWCKGQATHFQVIPAHALFCSLCTKQLRKMRRKQWLEQKRWKEKENLRAMEAASASVKDM